MKIEGMMKAALLLWIQTYADQLAEEVVEFHDTSRVAGSDESGEWVHAEITVVYRVHEDAAPSLRRWSWGGDAVALIRELDILTKEEE